MRDTAAQRKNTMIPIGALQQPSKPHVRHAESGARCKSSDSSAFSSDVEQRFASRKHVKQKLEIGSDAIRTDRYDGQRCALLTTKSRNTCTRATVFNSSG